MRLDSSDELLKAARAGDRGAADRLLEEHRAWLTGYIGRRVETPGDRSDLAQDVFLQAYKNLTAFRGDGPFSGWLLSIANNVLRNYYSRHLPRRRQETPWEEETTAAGRQRIGAEPSPSIQIENRGFVDQLFRHMSACCSDEERQVVALVYQGEPLEDIAALLGLNSATVRSHFHRGRGKLLAHLVQHDPGLLHGPECIAAAWTQALQAADPADRPTPDEQKAWTKPAGRARLFRSACLKMARHLPLPAVAWLLLLLGTPYRVRW